MTDEMTIGGGLKEYFYSLNNMDIHPSYQNMQWSDLPSHLLELICNQLDYGESIRFGAVCKSWQETATNYEEINDEHPLMFISIHSRDRMCHFHNIRDRVGSFSIIEPSDFNYGPPLSTSHGWFLQSYYCKRIEDYRFHLYNPEDEEAPLISLPPCPSNRFVKCGHIVRSPSAPGGFLIVMDKGQGNLSIMRSTYIRWRELSSPSSYFNYRFKNIIQIGMDDRLLYGLDFGGHLFTIDVFHRSITKLPVPRLKSDSMYLIESTGNVYIVLKFRNPRNGRYRPMKFKVFRLDLLNSAWVKVDDLGDRVAFHVSESCSTLVRTQKGMGNRIYFFDGTIRNKQYWSVYDMKNRGIKRGPKFNYKHVYMLSWFTPSLRFRERNNH